jgi:hypothetical protein
MHAHRVAPLVLAFLIVLSWTSLVAAEEKRSFMAELTADTQGPKPVQTEAHGKIIFELSEDGSALYYKLMVEDINDVYMAHLHAGQDTKYSQMVVWLYPVLATPPQKIAGSFTGILGEGMIRKEFLIGPLENHPLDDLVKLMQEGNAYVNVHTSKHIPGELRGQIK